MVTALAATPAARQQQRRQQPGVQLQPTVATSNPKLTSTNLLTELDQATQQVIGVDHLFVRLLPRHGNGRVLFRESVTSFILSMCGAPTC